MAVYFCPECGKQSPFKFRIRNFFACRNCRHVVFIVDLHPVSLDQLEERTPLYDLAVETEKFRNLTKLLDGLKEVAQ